MRNAADRANATKFILREDDNVSENSLVLNNRIESEIPVNFVEPK